MVFGFESGCPGWDNYAFCKRGIAKINFCRGRSSHDARAYFSWFLIALGPIFMWILAFLVSRPVVWHAWWLHFGVLGDSGAILLKGSESVLKGGFNVLTWCLKVKVFEGCKRVYMLLETDQGWLKGFRRSWKCVWRLWDVLNGWWCDENAEKKSVEKVFKGCFKMIEGCSTDVWRRF